MADSSQVTKPEWEHKLETLLPLYGHRNWIVVADSAYPAQSRPGIETIVSGAGQVQVVRAVAEAIHASRHVRATVYLDQELGFVAEEDSPGVTDYRSQLERILDRCDKSTLLHEQIIAKLDQVAQVFRVLIIKTEMTIPYTSVFFELGCTYWPAGAEKRMRDSMPSGPEE